MIGEGEARGSCRAGGPGSQEPRPPSEGRRLRTVISPRPPRAGPAATAVRSGSPGWPSSFHSERLVSIGGWLSPAHAEENEVAEQADDPGNDALDQ